MKECRNKNQTEQYGKKIWGLLLNILNETTKLQSANKDQDSIENHNDTLQQAEKKFWRTIENLRNKSESDEPFPPNTAGPVGESAVHICFLLGLKEIGMEMVQRYYNTEELINIEYQDDLKRYKDRVIGQKFFDKGLYTGETILHIAIVTCDLDVVEKLLEKGASLLTRAVGVFFMPPWIPFKKERSRWQKMKSRLLSFTTSEINKCRNEYSQVMVSFLFA